MRLRLSLTPSTIEFCERGDAAGPYPWILDIAALDIAARGIVFGTGSTGGSPSIDVQLDNRMGSRGPQAARIIGRPLRARAQIVDDDGAEFFAGLVAAITYGRVITLTINA